MKIRRALTLLYLLQSANFLLLAIFVWLHENNQSVEDFLLIPILFSALSFIVATLFPELVVVDEKSEN